MASAAIKPRVSAAVRSRDETIVNLLGSLQRHRDLDHGETALLERTVRRLTPPREVWRWSEKEDRLLKSVIRRWPRLRQQKPYQPNDPEAAREVGPKRYGDKTLVGSDPDNPLPAGFHLLFEKPDAAASEG
jgi:hypothetical protein